MRSNLLHVHLAVGEAPHGDLPKVHAQGLGDFLKGGTKVGVREERVWFSVYVTETSLVYSVFVRSGRVGELSYL